MYPDVDHDDTHDDAPAVENLDINDENEHGEQQDIDTQEVLELLVSATMLYGLLNKYELRQVFLQIIIMQLWS